MVNFYISNIHIEGFRGINNFEVDFSLSELSILIGPNNSGKSSLLDAIGLALNSPKFLNYRLSENDFYKNKKGEQKEKFLIEIKFTPNTSGQLPPIKGGTGDPLEAHGVRVIGNLPTLMMEFYVIEENNDNMLVNRSTPISNAKKEEYKGMGLTGRRYARMYDIKQWLPEIWQLDPKNLFSSLYVWKTGPLQKLLKIYKEKLLSEEWETSTKHKMPGALYSAYRFLNEHALKTPFWNDQLSPKLNSKFQEYLGSQTDIKAIPGLNSVDAWIMSEFLIQIAPADNLAPIDCKRLGDGWQNLLRLVALEVVIDLINEDKKALLLIEEPETYLHPHLRRKLRKVFIKLQSRGHQIIGTTHSQELISFNEKQKIIRLTMTKEGTEKYEYSTGTIDEAVKDEEKLYERGNHEMVFANRVILTEGKGDQYGVKLGLEKQEVDFDALSISIIDCGSVNNMPSYATICTKLGIPWFAIHDKDIQDSGEQKENTKKSREKLDALESNNDLIDEWDNDFEDIIGYRKDNPEGGKVKPKWIKEKWSEKTKEELEQEDDLKNYILVIEKIVKWTKNEKNLPPV